MTMFDDVWKWFKWQWRWLCEQTKSLDGAEQERFLRTRWFQTCLSCLSVRIVWIDKHLIVCNRCKPCKCSQAFGAHNLTLIHWQRVCARASELPLQKRLAKFCAVGVVCIEVFEWVCDDPFVSIGSKITRQINHQHGTARHLQVAKHTLWNTNENHAKCIYSCPMTWHRSMAQMGWIL